MPDTPATGVLPFQKYTSAKLLLVTALIFAAFCLLAPIRFIANDDIVMLLLASGRYSGEPSANLVFINHHLGWLISTLYAEFPGVEWYVHFQLLILSVAMAIPLSLLIDRHQDGARTGIAYAALLALAIVFCVIGLQFTTTAAIALCIGSWSILAAPGRTYMVIGVLLVLAAVLLRVEAALLALFVLAPFVCISLVNGMVRPVRVIILGLTMAISLGVHTTGERSFNSLYPEYAAYNSLRGQINDNPNADLSADDLPEGISETDYSLLRSFFPDGALFDPEDLRQINRAIGNQVDEIKAETWVHEGVNLLDTSDTNLLIVLLILLAIGSRSWPVALLTLAAGSAFFAPLLYVEMTATLKERVVFSAQFPIIASLFFLKPRPPGRVVRIASLVIVAAIALKFVEGSVENIARNAEEREDFVAQSALIRDWPGDIYVFAGSYNIHGARMLTDDLDAVYQPAIFLGWMVKHPDNGAYTDYTDFLRDDAAIFFRGDEIIRDYLEEIRRSFAENYGKTVHYRVIREEEDRVLMKFEED